MPCAADAALAGRKRGKKKGLRDHHAPHPLQRPQAPARLTREAG